MNQKEIELLNFENRILQDRRTLNDLIYHYQENAATNEIMDIKIKNLQAELDYMNSQLAIIMNGEQKRKNVVLAENTVNLHTNAPQAVIQNTDQPNQQQVHNMTEQNNTVVWNSAVENKHQGAKAQKDLENVIGKSWMGAIASVLIFISIIMFATLLLPILTDALKMTAMFAVSLGTTVFGLMKLRKEEKNPFFLSISGCGVGAIYISLLLSNLYFKAINDIALYLFILLWAVFVCILSRKRSILFQVIGQSGILIAVIFGSVLCVVTNDAFKFFVLTLFFVITSLIFLLVHMQKNFSGNLIGLLFGHVNVWILFVAYSTFEYTWIVYAVSYIVIAYIILLLGISFKAELINSGGFGILCNGYVCQMIFYMQKGITEGSIFNILMLCICAIMLIFTEWKFKQKAEPGKRLLQIFMMFLMAIAMMRLSFLSQQLRMVILALTFLGLGFYRKDKTYQFGSLAFMMLFLISFDMSAFDFACGLIYFVILIYLSITRKEQYSCSFKITSYILLLFVLCRGSGLLADMSLSKEAVRTILLFMIGSLNLVAMKSIGIRNYATGEKEAASEILVNIINSILMITAAFFIELAENEGWHMVVIFTAICLFMANSGNLLKQYQRKKEEMLVGVYIGIKLTILVTTILSSFEAANVVISIACFLFAIVSIMIGFRKHFKSLRVYGLLLSILSVVKLIMIDVSYDNLLGRAVGFFICGILCFVISLIYNTIDKRIEKEDKITRGQ